MTEGEGAGKREWSEGLYLLSSILSFCVLWSSKRLIFLL